MINNDNIYISDDNKKLLCKGILTITDLRKLLNMGRNKCSSLVSKLKYEYQDFYVNKSLFFSTGKISPLHICLYLHWDREDYYKLISTNKSLKNGLKNPILNINDVMNTLQLGRDKASQLVYSIRLKNKLFYNSPKHPYKEYEILSRDLCLYLGMTKNEYQKYILSDNC